MLTGRAPGFGALPVLPTLDFGEIVFNVVEVQLRAKQESDQKRNFAEAYDISVPFEGA